MAADMFLNGREISEDYPGYEKLVEQYLKIHRYKRYFVKKYVANGFSSQRYYELKFLPFGEALGYDNHPWKVIRDIEEILSALNEIASQQN
ncbi:hypothetical protein MWG07_09450 [Fusobacterium necrophorum]|uniref:Uncharacterized protein n=2 Tax=Fusobacterium necrophorum TaxID=859 RepID=A0AAW6WCG6_9FUSO|nr:hypothetical protein A2U03_06910 [Fusobacterium necrophorum subsp. funduliforme]KYM63226.1 hypothetical protein A2U09_08915 [Fusobacterium necrophorum subsp. funduliforme]KYM67092.1 hypothetical protein A2U13_08675 [Fusobacterium necrophorum subsp. funduliforme]MDK4512472.1 hypothetical protein [Fusobacterium necrophorum]